MAPAMMCVFDKVQSPIGVFRGLIRVCISFSANQAKEKNLVIWKNLKLINQIVSEKLS